MSSPLPEYGHALRGRWTLEADCSFLNHGSFGATPRAVLAAQDDWRARLERQPVRFLSRELPAALAALRERLGHFLHADPAGIAFVDNATTGVNAVLRGVDWRAGDVLVLGSHAYEAVRESVRYVADRHGIQVRIAAIPFPLRSADEAFDAYRQVITSDVRLALIDHVTSPSALVLPVDRIINLCREQGVPTLIDGAHAPGMLDLDIAALDADWYVGNCHKWLFAPKGCAFLWAAPARRVDTHPLVISKPYRQGYTAEFDWTGTRDPSAWLALGAALDFYADLGGAALCERNRMLVSTVAADIHRSWGTDAPAPVDMLGAMATLRLPEPLAARPHLAAWLHDSLWDLHRIELPAIVLADRLWLRISVQAYNGSEDYIALGEVVVKSLVPACPP